mmetsp:Transcript_40400/g.29769  ORF Transcript_40400/g.29769 Transcript_40400/m.29769 type:complete len:126 (+) Transcript_40400:718-1095(+)
MFFYLTIALSGYFSTYAATQPIMLERAPLHGRQVDYAVMLAMIAIITVVLESVPVMYIPLRQQCFFLLFNREKFSNLENLVSTGIFVLATCTLAIVYPNVTQVLSIMGGFCAANISFVIPSICYF